MIKNQVSAFVTVAYNVHVKTLQSVWDSCDNISRRKDTPALCVLKKKEVFYNNQQNKAQNLSRFKGVRRTRQIDKLSLSINTNVYDKFFQLPITKCRA